MLVLLSILIGISSLSVFTAGLLAFLRNPKKSQNRWFLVLTTFVAIWIVCNFVDSTISNAFYADLFLKFELITATFMAWALVEFAYSFSTKLVGEPKPRKATKLARFSTLGLNVMLSVFAFEGWLVTVATSGGRTHITYNKLFAVYVLVIFCYFGYAFYRLMHKRTQASGSEKGALNLIAGGIAVLVLTNSLTNILFPLLINSRATVKGLNIIGYLGFVVFVLAIYLAITTQKLFDIRLVVARSLGYILSLGTIGAIFVFAAFLVTNVLFADGVNQGTVSWLYALLAIILAMTFPPLKHFFDRGTNRFFYRDAYDAQAFLDELNKVLVSTYDIVPLLKKSSEVIEQNLKSSYCVFIIKETANTPLRIIGTANHPDITGKNFNFVRKLVSKKNQKVIITDIVEERHQEYQKILHNNSIEMLALLASNTKEEGLGYILLGPKKSGNLYTSSDAQIVEIIANELVITIQNALHTEEIENFSRTLQEKVNDATRKLRRTNERLKELDESKDDFISMASHQLRTPLTSVKGYISMVLEGDAGKITPMEREMLGQAFFSSQRMVYLISDLLNVSRLKTGKFIIEAIKVDLVELVKQELHQLEEAAASRSLSLTFEYPKDFPTLMFDETKTRQIIMNFTDNAIYYTPAGGHITVRLVNNPSTIELRVEDNGIGVPKHEQHHMFTKFYRAGNARQARPDGTGLGLFMAKKVIVAQGGSVIFESVEGKGSTFGFVFSKAKLAVPVEATPPAAVTPPAKQLTKV